MNLSGTNAEESPFESFGDEPMRSRQAMLAVSILGVSARTNYD